MDVCVRVCMCVHDGGHTRAACMMHVGFMLFLCFLSVSLLHTRTLETHRRMPHPQPYVICVTWLIHEQHTRIHTNTHTRTHAHTHTHTNTHTHNIVWCIRGCSRRWFLVDLTNSIFLHSTHDALDSTRFHEASWADMSHCIEKCLSDVCVQSHCDTLRHTATHCDTLQCAATHYNMLTHMTLHDTARHCTTLHDTATYCKHIP